MVPIRSQLRHAARLTTIVVCSLALSACKTGILEPQGPIGAAEKSILIDSIAIMLAIVLALAGGHALLYSVQAALIPELFGTRLRCTGASLGYQLAAPVAGGLAPLIAAMLIEVFPGHYWPLAAYIMVISVISLLCVHRLAETSRKDISTE